MSRSLDIAALLRLKRMRFSTELELQDRIQSILSGAGYGFTREAPLSDQDRIDFEVGGVGIEVKTDSSVSAVIRQLHRYAQHGRIASLVLVTSRSKHLAVPHEISGKLVEVVFTGAAL